MAAGQVGRNIPFAADVPTQRPLSRFYIDVLPYYMAIGLLGAGHLLWDCLPPDRASQDADMSRRYEQALYPLKHTGSLIGLHRGTPRLSGWYALRDPESEAVRSVFVREGAMTRLEGLSNRAYVHDVQIDGRVLSVRASQAGIAIAPSERVLVIATPRAFIEMKGTRVASVENGRYVGDAWRPIGPYPFEAQGDRVKIDVREPSVLRLQL